MMMTIIMIMFIYIIIFPRSTTSPRGSARPPPLLFYNIAYHYYIQLVNYINKYVTITINMLLYELNY